MKNKIISTLIAVAMVCTMLPAAVFAVEGDVPLGASSVGRQARAGGAKVQITTALDFTSSGDTSGDGYTWSSGTSTLTLNGLDLVTSSAVALKLPTGATVNIAGNSTISNASASSSDSDCYAIQAAGNVTFTGSATLTVISGTSTKANAESCAVYSAGDITVSGSTLNATGGAAASSCGVLAQNIDVSSGTLTATGGTATSSNGAYVDTGNITVSGGTFTAIGGTATADSVGAYVGTGNITVSGGTLNATGGTAVDSYGAFARGAITVSGGTLNATGGGARSSYGAYVGKGNITVSGIGSASGKGTTAAFYAPIGNITATGMSVTGATESFTSGTTTTLTQSSSDTPVAITTAAATYTVTGTVKDSTNTAVSATVKLMQGSTVIATATTDGSGNYSIANVLPGVYNVVVLASGKTITKGVVVAEEKTIDFTIPTGDQNTEVVVKSNTPDTSVEGLEDMFTAQDNTDAQTQKVEIKLEAETKAASALPAGDEAKVNAAKGNNTVGMYLDLQLLKTVGVTPAVTIQPPQGKALKITIALPTQLQGMLNYSIIRIHGTEVATFPAAYNTIAKTLTFSADKFSTYAIAYNNVNQGGGGYWYGGWAGSSDITVSFNSNGGSYVNPVKLSSGSTIDPYKYIPTKSGYAFGGWYTDSGLTKLVTANTRFNSNTTIYVRWLEESTTAPVTPSAPSTGSTSAGATSNPQTGDSWFANLFA